MRKDFYVALKDYDLGRENYSCWIYVAEYVNESGHGRSCWCLSGINSEVLIAGRMFRTFRSGEVTSMYDSLLQLFHCQFRTPILSR